MRAAAGATRSRANARTVARNASLFGIEREVHRTRACRNAARSRPAVAGSSSGSTRVSPTTDMKLVSPFQRGTTCSADGSRTPAPAGLPEVQAHVEAVRLVDRGQHALGRLRQRSSAPPARPASRSASRPTCRSGTTIRWPLLYGNLFRMTNVRRPRCDRGAARHRRADSASQKMQPAGAELASVT